MIKFDNKPRDQMKIKHKTYVRKQYFFLKYVVGIIYYMVYKINF